MERFWIILAVAGGGAIGAVGRWSLSEWMVRRVDARLGWYAPTMTINILGSLLIGFCAVWLVDPPAAHPAHHKMLRFFLMTGILGGFTTFSTFSMETLRLLQQDRILEAMINALGSVIAGLAAAAAGYTIGRYVFTP